MQILNANFKCKIKIFMAKSKYLWQNNISFIQYICIDRNIISVAPY